MLCCVSKTARKGVWQRAVKLVSRSAPSSRAGLTDFWWGCYVSVALCVDVCVVWHIQGAQGQCCG